MRTTPRVLALILVLLAPGASAHFVALPGAGNSLDRAIALPTPSEEHAHMPPHQGARYYLVSLDANQTLRIRLERAPTAFTDGQAPILAIAGPNLSSRGTLPPGVQIPPNTTAILYPTSLRPALQYEYPNEVLASPLLQLDFTAPQTATYTLIVLAPESSGAYGLHLDAYPRWSLATVLATENAANVHAVEGQTWIDDWLPTILAIPLTLALAWLATRLRPGKRSLFAGLCVLAAILLANTALAHLYQAWWHHRAGASWGLVQPSLVSGAEGLGLMLATLTLYATSGPRPHLLQRLAAPLLGVAALATWNGGEYGVILLPLLALVPGDAPAADKHVDDEAERVPPPETPP